MDCRTPTSTVFFLALFFAPSAVGQVLPPPITTPLAHPGETSSSDLKPGPLSSLTPTLRQRKSSVPSGISKTTFVLLSAGVYGASLADMHQTLRLRNFSWWRETDPFAKPFARLPAPAYYAGGLAIATAVNWLSWRMARSKRWHKLAPIPQLISISGNSYGIRTGLN
jgi:hypothetical protein